MDINRKCLFLLLATITFVGTGCLSHTQKGFNRQVKRWAPPGTSVAKATDIMQQHRFRCEYRPFQPGLWQWWADAHKSTNWPRDNLDQEPWPGDELVCFRVNSFWNSTWTGYLHFEDGKLVSYGPPTMTSDPLRIFSNMH